MRDFLKSEQIFLEPSACAAFQGVVQIEKSNEIEKYLKENHLKGNHLTSWMQDAVHIVWATGGSLVPEEIREEYKNTYLEPEKA